jgi:hypothetical protein
VTQQSPAASSASSRAKHGWRQWDAGVRAGVISAALAAVGLVIATLAWLLPRSPDPRGSTSVPPSQAPTSSAPQASTSPAGSPKAEGSVVGVDYLDMVTTQAGGDRLVELPRELRGQAQFAVHPVPIKCPTNQTSDRSSDVTYPLYGKYVRFHATVRPYYPRSANQRSVTYVYAIVGIKQKDGSLATKNVGQQLRATPTAPGGISADVDGAQELILRVQCEDPDGIIVLTDGHLTVVD